jgi:hypothetical protein
MQALQDPYPGIIEDNPPLSPFILLPGNNLFAFWR